MTARKWEELPGEVPRSVTTVPGEQIRDAGIREVRQAARYVPNMIVTEFSSRRLSFPFVRGVGSGQGDPAVGTFIDGVPQLQVSSTNLPLLDVERVEILRGPHGALYGRNTIGGAMNIISRRPSSKTEVDADVTFGNFALQEYRIVGSVPIERDKLSVSFAGVHQRRDGYTDNDFTGNDVDDREMFFGRAQVLWTPDTENEVRFSVHSESSRDGGFVLSDYNGLRARPNKISQDYEGFADRDVLAGSLTWTRSGDEVDFTSITAGQWWDIEESTDFDFSALDGVRRFTTADQTYVYQELRFASAEDRPIVLSSEAELKWLWGVSGFWSDSEQGAANEFRPGGAGIIFFPPQVAGTDQATGSFDSYAAAAFAQATIDWKESWEFTGALRYEYESKDADIDRRYLVMGFPATQASTSADESFDEILPRLSVSYQWSEELMAYVLAARGFKAGGFNLTAPSGSETFGPEKSWTYEAGFRSSSREGKVVVAGSLFFIEWDDMQLSQFNAQTGGYVTNAGQSTSMGAEIEIVSRPIEGVQLFAGVGVLDTEFDRFTDQFGADVSGKDLPFAPENSGNVGIQVSKPIDDGLTCYVRAEHFHVGDFFYDAGNLKAESYNLTNFRVGLGGEQWRIDGWIRNAFDNDYIPVAFQPNPGDPTAFVGESAAPQTYGVTLRVRF